MSSEQKTKPSKVPWIGDIPNNWGVQRLKFCAPLINEKVDASQADLPFIGLEHIEPWTGKRIKTNEASSSDGLANKYCPSDVLFGKLRPYLAKVLKATDHGVCTGELLVLRPKLVCGEYLFYYLLNRAFISTVDASTYGAKMPRANWDFIGNLPLLLPPHEDQLNISTFLVQKTLHIDELINKKQRQLELLQEKRAAIISHAVTKGLDPNAPMKESGINWIGKIPAHWELVRLGRKITLQRGIDITRDTQNEGIVPVVSSGGITSFHNKAIASGPGVIVGRKGTAGAVYYIQEDYWPHDTTLWVKEFRNNIPRFVFYKLSSMDIASYDTGSANPTINRNLLHPILVSWPPVNEQTAIVDRLDRETGRIDATVKKVEASIIILQEYRVSIISAAVTGKIDVRKETAHERAPH